MTGFRRSASYGAMRARLTYSNVMSSIAVGGTTYAAATITSGDVKTHGPP